MPKLFEPVRVGPNKLDTRIALAPLTRLRSDDDWVPLPVVKEYYEQRASVPGTMLITEATAISKGTVGVKNVPGIWSEAQILAWKDIVDAVHKKGSFIYLQLWHMGRAGQPSVHQELGTKLKSSSAVPIDDASATPEEMTEDEIKQTIQEFADAAKNAVKAGFDGVEIHGANGYLIDQFTQDNCNRRTDSWGGSIENRARFAIEVTKAVVEAIGADKTGIRLSPFSTFQSMLMKDPYPQFKYLVRQLKALNLAYLHLVEPRIAGSTEGDTDPDPRFKLGFFVKIWDNQSPIVVAGGFTAESAAKAVEETYKGYDIIVAFGRYFISNPDLVFRLKTAVDLAKYDRSTFYIRKSPKGYVDYPFSSKFLAKAA
ncbi:hypothetical protein DL769_005893 [Monosporascus sp. CRB-8-3]|nr:hypothetical protein DL769_005893 [Monosporascus sp. CRB-8-3]